MPYAGMSSTPPSQEELEQSYKYNAVPFISQKLPLLTPRADQYVARLFKEAPEAKDVVRDKLAVVTGVTVGGIGYHMAEELAVQAEMHVILLGRSQTKLKETKSLIEKTATRRGCEIPILTEALYDLNSLQSVEQAATYVTQIAKEKYDGALHVLINNAGSLVPTYGTTEDGVECNIGQNYIAPHMFTSLLLPLLKQAAKVTPSCKPRVVHVASSAHALGDTWDPKDLLEHPERGGGQQTETVQVYNNNDDNNNADNNDALSFRGGIAGSSIMYGNSKYGLISDAIVLTKLHPEINFSSHQPGVIASKFFMKSGVTVMTYYGVMYWCMYSPSQGARAALRAALDPDFNTVPGLQGAYLHCGDLWKPVPPKVIDPSTKEPYTHENYAQVLYETVEQVIDNVYRKK